MTKFSNHAIVFLIPVALWSQQQTETIRLRNGTEITGGIVRADERDVTIRDQNNNIRRFTFDQVDSITFNGPREGFYRNNPPPPPPRARGDYSNYPGDMTLPSGTEISVRTNARIDSDANADGNYPAQVERDVVDIDGDVLIPRGSEARLIVRRLGNNSLSLDLDSVRVNGQNFRVSSEDITQQGKQGLGENRRTGEYVGGGAVLGTLLGAIAGGGKGAAIGALAGGAAGAGAQVLTRGDHVRVPAETVLNFRLDRPLYLNSMR